VSDALGVKVWDIRTRLTYECRYCGYEKTVNFGKVSKATMYSMLEGAPPDEFCPHPECAVAGAVDRYRSIARSIYNGGVRGRVRSYVDEDWEDRLRMEKEEPPDAFWIYLQVVGEEVFDAFPPGPRRCCTWRTP